MIRHILFRASLLFCLLISTGLWAAAPAPLALTLPLLGTPAAAAQHLDAAKAAGKGYLIDLAAAEEGIAFLAKPAPNLAPGRYRLHVLVNAGPGKNDVVDPVELLLSAGAAQRHVYPGEIPKTGELADISLDFAVTDAQPTPVALKWFVGDSLLKVPEREKFRARQDLLKRRAAEIADPGQAPAHLTDGLAETGDAGLGEEAGVQMVVLAEAATPKYRLVIAGAHLEALCPVAIAQVQTDKVAYDPGEAVRLTVTLKNFAQADAQVELAAALAPAAKEDTAAPGKPLTASVTVPAGGTLTHAFPEALPTGGLTPLTRVSAQASYRDTRPASGETLFALAPPKRPARVPEKKIYAHYMGCWPIGTGALYYQRQNEGKELRHEVPSSNVYYYGGHVRNFDLVDPTKSLTPEESADLEIRRAMRIGIDGFAIDAWAGGDGARQTVDALFKVAEAKDYPFSITICIDPTCGGSIVDSVRELLDKHGKSPKLARRDGKPLIFGYQSVWTGFGNLMTYAPDRVDAIRAQPIGWHILGQALGDAARQLGQPIYYHYCLSAFFFNVDAKRVQKGSLTEAAGILGRYADAVGAFSYLGDEQPAIAKAVRASGAEWSLPVGMYQKENIPYECYVPKGTDWMHWGRAALEQDATLLQIVTWNDYGENTNIAPAWNTRYTLYDLTGYEIALWKSGKEPVPDHDRVYLIYRKYPPGAKIFPFHAKFAGVDGGVIEVLTILPAPAHVRLPGRAAEFDAPAGFHRQQFPVTAGPMIAELVRDGKVVLRLESPEPITDKPFREDNGLVCWSSEEERLWKEDFGDAPPFWYSEYGDVDHDGLPNWFEMYWFSRERGFVPKKTQAEELEDAPVHYSRWLDFSTAGLADPKADPDGDGQSNLEEYMQQTDPTLGANPDLEKTELDK